MLGICRKCSCDFEVPPGQMKTYDYICRECKRAKEKAYRQRRKAAGKPIKCARISKEARRAYENGPAKIKANVRVKLREAVKAGKVKKLPCRVCGDVKSEGHHEDYSKPFDVIWLCKVHHAEVHPKF